jgi:hypothetical protein
MQNERHEQGEGARQASEYSLDFFKRKKQNGNKEAIPVINEEPA